MNNKIIVFRGKSGALAPGKALTANPARVHVQQFQPRPKRPARSFVLRVTWRRDSESGRLECRWIPDRDTTSEEGASRGHDAAERMVAAVAPRRRSFLYR